MASKELIKEKLSIRKKRQSLQSYFAEAFVDQEFTAKVEFIEHHLCHLASAYLVSPFDSSNIISVDGFGDFASVALATGEGQNISVNKRIYFPHSLGIFYQALTQYLGFPHYGDEYKIMGLAPYGEAKFREQMDEIVIDLNDGSFELNLNYFVHHKNPIGYEWDNGSPKVSQLYSDKLEHLLGRARDKEAPIEQFHMDLARSIQDKYERSFFHLINGLNREFPNDNLSIAGGCGMNSVANGKVHLNSNYQNVYIQSAAGDAGGAIGAALIANQDNSNSSERFAMTHSYWGSSFSDQECLDCIRLNQAELDRLGCQLISYDEWHELVDKVSSEIIEGKVIGWFQGSMEWGPRALGNRSILGDPRRQDMKDILNLKIKRRESFRPFAPSVLRSEVSNWFESEADVPFMMKVFQIRSDKRNQIPAVAHVDGSGRLQTVTKESNPKYHSNLYDSKLKVK